MLKFSEYIALFFVAVIDYLLFINLLKPIIIDFLFIRKLIRNGTKAKGIVVDFESKLDLDQRVQYAPVVFFTDSTNKENTVKSNDYRLTKVPLHSSVDVIYYDDDPSTAVINPRSLLSFKSFLIALVFLVIAAINIGIIYKILN